MPWYCSNIALVFLQGILVFNLSGFAASPSKDFQLSFEKDRRCTYSYQVSIHTARGSYSTANQGYQLHALIDVTPAAQEDSHNPLYTIRLDVYQPRLRRSHGNRVHNHPVNEEIEQKLAKPFYFRQSKYGTVVDTFFPRNDDAQVIALKKGIASAFQVHLKSLNHKRHSKVKESDDSGIYLSKYVTIHANDTHATVKREWTNKDYIHLADGTPVKGEHKLQSKHTGIVHVHHGQIFKVHRQHSGVIESAKGHPRTENAKDFQNEEDIRIFTSGYSKLALIGCKRLPSKSMHHRSKREVNDVKSEIEGLYRDDLVFKDTHKLNWKDVGGEKTKFRPFYEVMRCFTDRTVSDSEKGECAREIHKQAQYNDHIFNKICNLVLERSHQNVTSWSVLVSVLAGKGDIHAQNMLAGALISERPRKLTLDEYESLLEGIFYIPKGPLHKNLFDALLQHSKRDVNHGHQIPMAMLVLAGLTKRAESAGYNTSLSDVVVKLIHHSYHNKSNLYNSESEEHEAFLRNHIWAFGNLGHLSGLNTMLTHANHDSSGIRSAVVSGMRKLPVEHTKKFLLDSLYNDERNDVKAAVIEVYIERHEDLSDHIVQALEHAIWHAKDGDGLDETIQTFLENHYNHPKAKHIRKRRHILRRQKRALIPALRPREFTLGPNRRWVKRFGNNLIGAESIIQFQNQVSLRIGLFGGSFEVTLDNHAKLHGHLWKWGFDIVKGKAAFKASASFKNDIPKDLIHTVADLGDDILATADGITNIIVVHIQKFIDKFKKLVPLNINMLIDFVNQIIKFVKNLIKPLKPINLMKKILTLAKKAIERLKNWEWLMNNIRTIQSSLNKLTVVDDIFEKVMNALKKIMTIINSIKLRLPHGLPPNFKIEDLLKWLKPVSVDLHDTKMKEYFKSFGENFVPKGFTSQMPFRFSMHFSFSMDRFVDVCMSIIKFSNNFLDLSSLLDAFESIRLPRLNLPRLEAKFPLQQVKRFNFGLHFDWKLSLKFDLNLKSPNFLNFLKVLGKLSDFFKQFKLPSFNLERFFEDIMPNKLLDLSKIFGGLFGKKHSTAVGRTPADGLQDFLNKILNLIDLAMPNITTISDITDFFKELGPAMKTFTINNAKKICSVYKIALNTSRDFKTFGENIEKQGITILKTVDNTTKSAIQELVHFTTINDKLIDDIEKNFTLETRGFVSQSLKELTKSLREIQSLVDKVVDFGNGASSNAIGVCNKAADFSANIIDDVQNVSRRALSELTSFIGPVAQKVKGIGNDFKTAVDNIENWYKENMEARVGKISKIARLVADFMSILNTNKGFLGEVHNIAQKVNEILTHMKNIPTYAQKARETADDIINFADRAHNFKNDIAKLDIRKELNIDYDKKVREFCDKFKKIAIESINKIGGYDIVDEVNAFFTDEAEKLISKAGSMLRQIKQPIEDMKTDLQAISTMVSHVMNILINLKPLSNTFSPILATVNQFPDCQQAVNIFTENTKPCVQKAMVVGNYAIDQYKDMRKEVKVLYDMIPETWKSLKIQKCIKGSACISKVFIDQAKVIQEKVEKLKNNYKEASGYTDMLGTCRAGLDKITQVIDNVNLLVKQVKDFNIKDDVKNIKDMLRDVTGRNSAQDEPNSPVRSRRSTQDVKDKIQRVMDYVRKAEETKVKLEQILQNTFKAMKSVFDNAIFEHIKKIEDVNTKVTTSYEIWKKTKDMNSVIQGLDNIIKEASDYATKISGITNIFSSPLVNLLTDTGELSDVIKPHLAKYINKVKEATDKVNGFFKKVTDFQNKIQLRQRGLDLSEYKEWSAYPYCSADVCLRPLRRSSSLYYSTIFTWKFPHLDDLSSMQGSGRWLVPGLFDNYKVEGITQLSDSDILLGMHGVSANQGKASLIVVTDLGQKTVKKIIQLGSPDAPFTDAIGGVTIAKYTIWISDSQSNQVHRISKASVTGSMSSHSPSWIKISKTYSVEGVATSVSFDEQKTMLWVTDGRQGKGYGYRLTPSGDLLSSNLAPDRVLVIGKDAQGMAIMRQFNTEYVAVSKCALRAGFQCKLEFHDLTDGDEISENSLSRVVRTPSGLESIDKTRDKTNNDLLVVAFSSGTYSEGVKIESVGGDFEDRFFRIKIPILKMTFAITENCLMLKFMGDWIVSPKRLIPTGQMHCGSFRKRSIEKELLQSDVYSQELEGIHQRNKRSTKDTCMKPVRGNVLRGYQQFMPEFNQWFIVFGIPIKLFVGIGGHYYLDYQVTFCIKDRAFKVALIPGAWVRVEAGVSVCLFIVEAGITVEADILETSFIPELTAKFNKWPLRACIELKMRMTPLRIRIFFWYRLFCGIDIDCGILWCTVSIRWTSKRTFKEWSWSSASIERTLFTNCEIDRDGTPPNPGSCSARQVGDKTYFVQWHGFEEDTKIHHYWVKIGSIFGSGDDYGTNVGTSLSVVVRNLPIMNGRDVFVSIRATNDDGLESRLALCPVFKAKRIGPQIRFVYDGSQAGVDKDYQSDDYGMGLNFAWGKANQNIVDVKWGIATTANCTFDEKEVDVYGLAPVGETITIQTSGLRLKHATKYYTRIIAINSIGLRTIMCSDGLTIDTTPPIAGYFFDGAGNEDKDFTPSTKRVRAKYEPFTDNESSVVKYEWKVIQYIDLKPIDITPFVNIPLTQKTPLMENLDLQLGQKYHLILRGTNAAGLQATKESDGFVADDTIPICSPVLDILTINGTKDVDFVRQLSSIQAKWNCVDKESGMTKQHVAIGSYPGGDNVRAFENVNQINTTRLSDGCTIIVKIDDIEIKPKVRYHVTVKAYNGAGLRRTVTSDGILIDTTPPSVAIQYIKDGYKGKDVNYTKERFTFSAHWEQAFVDAESGIAEYRIGLGTVPGATDVKQFKSVGNATKGTLSGLILHAGKTYYVTVVGCNGVQMCINGSSNGAIVDFVPPHPGAVITGFIGPPVLFQWVTKSVWARWDWCPADANRINDLIDPSLCTSNTFYDIHSGIRSFGLSVTSLASEGYLDAFTEVGRVQMSGRSIDLRDGVYSVAVRAKDKAGMIADGFSNTFIVDSSPPKITNLQHGDRRNKLRYTRDGEHRFTAYFELEDDLSRVFSYMVYVGSYPGAVDVSSSHSIQLLKPTYNIAVNWTAERSSKLENNRKYYVTVLAINGAKLVGSGSSEALFSDTEPPRNAIVLDGWGMEDVKYQSYSSIYRAHWYGLIDFSGVQSIYLCLKSSLDKHECDVKDYELVPSNVNYHVLYGLKLKSGSTYFGCLKVVDNAQNEAYFPSNGVVIDSTPPVPGHVFDGISGADIDVQIENSILWASWKHFKEEETNIIQYHLAFGTSPGKHDIQEFTNVGHVHNAASTRLKVPKLTSGQRYYATVVALNSIGIQSALVSSNGVMVDATPPVFTARVSHGAAKGVNEKYTSSQSLSVCWKCVDKETGLASVSVAFGLQPGSNDVMNFTSVPLMQTTYVFNTNLQLGIRYFATVIGKNKVGLKSVSSSDGVVYDNTPPKRRFVRDDEYQNSTSKIAVRWSFYDIESGVSKYQIFVHNSDQSSHQGPYDFSGVVNSASISLRLPLKNGKKYYTNVTAYNGVGMVSSLLSNGFLVDTTPPTCDKVWHGDKNVQRFIGITNTLVVSWRCSENESTMSQIRFAVQDMSSQQFILPFHSKKERHNATGSTAVTGNGKWLPKYEEGKRYRVGIELTNAVHLKSVYWTSGVLVDSTPPVVNNLKVVFNPTSDALVATWKLKDEQSGIASIKCGLGSSPDKADIISLHIIHKEATDWNVSESELRHQHGITYFVFLVATDVVGISTAAVSNGVIIDRSPPSAGIITVNYVLPINYDRSKNTVSGASLSVSWTGFTDQESGIAKYSWSLGYNSDNVRKLDNNYYTKCYFGGVQIKNLTLSGNTTYCVCVRATNGAGLQRTDCSTNITIVLGQFNAGEVNDGPKKENEDLDFQLDNRAIWAFWDGFQDPVYGISFYEWCIGDRQPTPFVPAICKWPFETVNHLRKYAHRFYNITLSQGTKYYITVRAFNRNGQSVNATSDGVLVDRSPPLRNSIKVSPTSGQDTLYVNSQSPPTITWDMDDKECGMKHFMIGVGSYQLQDDLIHFTKVNYILRSKDLDDMNFTMSHGLQFSVTIVGHNMLGLESKLTTQQVVVDLTPPSSGTVYDGNGTSALGKDIDYQTSKESISAHWVGFKDSESGIIGYRWCVGLKQETCNVMEMISTGVRTSAITHLNLQNGLCYFATVEATNGAGLKVLSSSDGVCIDSSPPSVGKILFVKPSQDILLISKGNLTMQSSGKSFKVVWDNLHDAESGISSLKYCLGKHQGTCEVIDWVELKTDVLSHFSILDNPLQSGTMVYMSLKITNRAGLNTIRVSDPLLIDESPPNDGMVILKNLSQDKYLQTESINAVWRGFEDRESNVDHYEWVVCLAVENEECLTQFINVGLTTKLRNDELDLKPGMSYVLIIRAYNKVGLFNSAVSNIFILDNTRPTPGGVFDGSEVSKDIEVQSSTTTISANWEPFESQHSTIDYYEMCVGSKTLLCDVHDFQSFGKFLAGEITGLNLTHHQTYFSTIRATNEAGHPFSASSNGIKIDQTPPVGGSVRDGSGPDDLDFQAHGSFISANWDQFTDDETGIEKYIWCAGTTRGACDVVRETEISDGSTKAQIQLNPSIISGVKIFSKVSAVNGAGGMTTLYSDGVDIDDSPPKITEINDLETNGSLTDVNFLTSKTKYCSSWNAVDLESGICKSEVSVCTTIDKKSCLVKAVDVGNLSLVCMFNLNFIEGVRYTTVVRVTNNVGLSTTAYSDGFIFDFTPPNIGYIYIGNGASDGAEKPSDFFATSAIDAYWDGFWDKETSMLKYHVCLGNQSGSCDVADWKDVGLQTSYKFENVNLVHARTYYVSVVAENQAGLKSIVTSSEGVFIDKTAPIKSFVYSGNNEGTDVKFQQSVFEVHAHWNSFEDLESDVILLTYCVGYTPGDCDILPRQKLLPSLHKMNEMLPRPMNNGQQFYATVQATNGANLTTTVTSEGVTVDSTPPLAGQVFDGNSSKDIDFLNGEDDVVVTWANFKDDESGIKGYQVAICNFKNITDCPQPFTDVNNETSIKITGLDFDSGTEYITRVQATNHVGLQTEATSNGFTVDFTPPITNVAWIGPGWDHVKYQADTQILHVRWMPFTDDESGIEKYELCIQNSLTSDCNPYVNVGQKEDHVFSGLTLEHGKSYFVNIKATNGAGMAAFGSTGLVMVDTTPPVLAGSPPGPHIRINCTEEVVSVVWDEFGDPQSELSSYYWCVGANRGVCDVVPKRSSEGTLFGKWKVRKLSSGTSLFATVFISNAVGLTTILHSKQCNVITAAPNVIEVLDLSSLSNSLDVDWTSNMHTLNLKWTLGDVAGVRLEVAVTQASSNVTVPRLNNEHAWNGEPLVQNFIAVHSDQQNITIETVPITSWKEYRGVVRMWNEGGIYSEKSSGGIRIEPSPPLPRKVVLQDSAEENEKSRWLPNLHLQSFNLSGLDPEVRYVSSPDDISIAVSDISNTTNSTFVKLNRILDSGAFSPTKDFKLLVTRVTSDSNETNTTEHSFETKTLPGFAGPSGPCCANHTPSWLTMQSDIHYKPTSSSRMFGSSVVQLANDYVAVSSLHKVFIFSKKSRLLENKVISLGDDNTIDSLSYSNGHLVVTCSGLINVYELHYSDIELELQLQVSISNCKNNKCDASVIKWSELDGGKAIIQNTTIAAMGKNVSHNSRIVGIFRKDLALGWKLVKELGTADNHRRFGQSFSMNYRFIAVLSSAYTVSIYSTFDFMMVMKIGLQTYGDLVEPNLKLTKDNVLVLLSKSKGKVVVLQLNIDVKSSQKVCSYFAPFDVRLSGNFDLFDRDGGTVIALGMIKEGRDGVILTAFYGNSVYHPYHQNGKCLGLGQVIALEDFLRVDDGKPRASVSAEGSIILFGTPGVLTWPDGSEKHGTGRVYSMVFCPRNYKRIKTSDIKGQDAFQCEPCKSGRKSLGAITRICEVCKDRRCASPLDDDPIHFVSKICNDTQCPLVKQFNNKTNAIKIIQENGTFFEEGVVNEYTIKLVETTRANMSTTSMSESFIIDTSSPTVGTVFDGLGSNPDKNCSKNETLGEHSQCSTRDFQDTDIDYTNNTSEVHARWLDFADNESDIAEYFFCIGSKPMMDDIRQCESTGLRQNASRYGFDFNQGDTYYVTVVACNGAQRCSAGHTNGVTIDTTPPVMQYVRDGVMGPDIDYQVFLDLLFVYFKASDPESEIRSYEVAWGTEPGLVDMKDFEEILNTTVWFSKFKDNTLKKKTKYYATVRATNKAGLLSDPLSSNGVQVGKSEYIFDNNASASFFFDTVNANANGTREDDGVGKTYGTLDVPKGAVEDEVKLTCYSLDKETLESNKSDEGPVANPEATKPKQFMLGNYSFQIKASDPENNTIREGYKFAKPIKISMFYDVDNLVNANKRVVNNELEKDDVDPVLYLWDLKNETWIDASLTCPEPWSHVNRSIKMLTVQICHLTQFSFYWSFKAQKGLMMFDKNNSVYDAYGDINIVQQSSNQEIQLPVKRSKGSSGSIEVTWSLYSKETHHHKIIWPDSGKISFKEGQWNSSIVVFVASNEHSTQESYFGIRLENTTGGAILASDNLTTTRLVVTSIHVAASVHESNTKWIITGVFLVLMLLIVVAAVIKRQKLADIICRRTGNEQETGDEVEMSSDVQHNSGRENQGFDQLPEHITTSGQSDNTLDENSAGITNAACDSDDAFTNTPPSDNEVVQKEETHSSSLQTNESTKVHQYNNPSYGCDAQIQIGAMRKPFDKGEKDSSKC